MTSAVFLDRDGVVNDTSLEGGEPRPPRSRVDVVIPDDVRPAVATLRDAGFTLIIVTNQPDVARGRVTLEAVDEINQYLVSTLGLDGVYACVHDGSDGCECRKPKPGMLVRAARDLELDLATSWLIGDRWVDIAAARAAGVRSVLLERPYSWAPTSAGSPPTDLVPTFTVPSIMQGALHVVAA